LPFLRDAGQAIEIIVGVGVQEIIRAVNGRRQRRAVADIGKLDGEIACRERLGGMLKFYYRKAA
jgi:hypothetical protein